MQETKMGKKMNKRERWWRLLPDRNMETKLQTQSYEYFNVS